MADEGLGMKILWFADSPEAPDPAALLGPEHSWVPAGSLGEALFELEEERSVFGTCVICLPLRRDDPYTAMEEIQRLNPSLPIVVLRDGVETAELDLVTAAARFESREAPVLQPG